VGITIQTIKDIRLYLAKELESIYQVPEINAIANIIIKTTIGITRLQHLYRQDENISDEQAERIIEICDELKTGKPVQYILGETIFFDCIIKLTSATLIPRQETEELVDLIIKENKGYSGNIIDIGTGSGCIAVALAANLPLSDVTGTDISDEALRISGENALLNKVSVTFLKSDIFSFDPESLPETGIIVSNPPYVRNSEKKFMSKNVLNFEPHEALFVPDNEPLVYYEAILRFAEQKLLPGGKVYFEINEALGKSMEELFASYGYYKIQIIKDINGKDRIIKGIKDV
jgi:release factor glutamine methyltransferase